MEDNFIVPDSETTKPSQRSFHLAVGTLLATLILSSLCVITLFVTKTQADSSLSQLPSTSLPANTPVTESSATLPLSATGTVTPTIATSTPLPGTAESAKGALRIIEYAGAHRVVEYEGLRSQSRPEITNTPHSPHRIIRYKARIINYELPSQGEDSNITGDEASDAE